MASRNLSHRSHGHKETGKKVSRVRRQPKLHEPIKECSGVRPTVVLTFRPCRCRLSLKNKQIHILLPVAPPEGSGERRRLLGVVTEDRVLKIFRSGKDYFIKRQCFAISKHLLESAQALGFNRVWVDTYRSAGFLPSIERLLQRTSFQYAAFEAQVPFTVNELTQEAA